MMRFGGDLPVIQNGNDGADSRNNEMLSRLTRLLTCWLPYRCPE